MNNYSPTSQPPSCLADVLNPAEEHRDSAYFSSSSNGDASKHTSIASTNRIQSTPPSGYQSSVATDKTPSPINTQLLNQPLISPTSNGMSVASMVSPTTPASLDQSMLAKLDSRTSGDVSQRTSGISLNGDSNSRRESVESRMNTGFEGMRLQNSPYASNNQSTTSIQASLQQQRNPGNNTGPERLSASRFTPVYTPSSAHFGSDAHKRSKVAPTITGPADSSVAHGAVPIAGQAWAFPTDIDHRMPSSGRSSEAESRQTSYIESRRSSLASLASSQYTTESRLPPGQRRLDEVYPQEYRNSRASSEFQGASHHHHSLQHRQVGDLRDEEGGSPGGSQPYSRTPELRVSHKLAERKRRNEMKELYEELRDLMPQERGNKASKWEILSKAISEHKHQQNQIRYWKENIQNCEAELQKLRLENSQIREENMALRKMHDPTSQAGHSIAIRAGPPTPADHYAPDPYRAAQPPRPDPRGAELPPLRALHPPPMQSGPDSMMGVQYHERGGAYQPPQAFQPRV